MNITTVSSKGQLVIPEEIREKYGVSKGTKFLVLGEGQEGSLILKRITEPSADEIEKRMKKAQEEFRSKYDDKKEFEEEVKQEVSNYRKLK